MAQLISRFHNFIIERFFSWWYISISFVMVSEWLSCFIVERYDFCEYYAFNGKVAVSHFLLSSSFILSFKALNHVSFAIIWHTIYYCFIIKLIVITKTQLNGIRYHWEVLLQVSHQVAFSWKIRTEIIKDTHYKWVYILCYNWKKHFWI